MYHDSVILFYNWKLTHRQQCGIKTSHSDQEQLTYRHSLYRLSAGILSLNLAKYYLLISSSDLRHNPRTYFRSSPSTVCMLPDCTLQGEVQSSQNQMQVSYKPKLRFQSINTTNATSPLVHRRCLTDTYLCRYIKIR